METHQLLWFHARQAYGIFLLLVQRLARDYIQLQLWLSDMMSRLFSQSLVSGCSSRHNCCLVDKGQLTNQQVKRGGWRGGGDGGWGGGRQSAVQHIEFVKLLDVLEIIQLLSEM